MARAELARLADKIEAELFKSSSQYREAVSDLQAHGFRVDSADIIKEVKKEMKQRRGGFGEDLPPSIVEVIEREVPIMVAKLYRLFNPKRAIFKRSTTKVTPQRLFGSETSFVFTLAAQTKDSPNVFKAFRDRKKAAQRPLVRALDEEIKKLNAGTSTYSSMYRQDKRKRRGSGEEYTVNVVDDFLDIGHEDASAVFLQRGQAAEQALLQFEGAHTEAQQFVNELLQEFHVVLDPVRPKGKNGLRLVRASLESSSENRKKGLDKELSKSKQIQEIFNKILVKENWPEHEGSDSPLTMVEKKLANEVLLTTTGHKKVKTNFKNQKIKKSDNKPVKSKGRKNKGSVSAAFKDKEAVRFKKSDQKTRQGQGSELSISVLLGLLNQNLSKTVQKNMGPPGLQNRTGRFAGSVRAVEVIKTAKGFPSVGYTYQRNPYEVYESSSGSRFADAERDPRKVIGASIREIAAQYLQTRIFTRRL
jgi:hypothetical protein